MRNFLVIISAVILLAGTVSAQMGDQKGGPCTIVEKQIKMGPGRGMCGGKGDCGGPMMFLKFADELGLTAEQKTRISKMQEEFGILMIDKKAELEKAELRLHLLMKNDGAEKDVLAAMDKVGVLKTEIKKMRFAHHNQMKAVLTADQLKKLDELRPKMGCGKGAGMGMNMKCGSGQGMNMNCGGHGPRGMMMNDDDNEDDDTPGMGPGFGCMMPCFEDN
jgi:Spy/CpxP family protein refolding chaperone